MESINFMFIISYLIIKNLNPVYRERGTVLIHGAD